MKTKAEFTLASMRGFYVGGDAIEVSGRPIVSTTAQDMGRPIDHDPNGDHEAKQIYVSEYRLSQPHCRWPILFCHGGALTGALWEGRPDGSEGWLTHFLREGFDACVADGLGLGRSSSLHQAVRGERPVLRSKKEMWEHFRIGPRGSYESDKREAHPGTAFPAAAFDQFAKSVVPRWLERMEDLQQAYEAVIESVGPCIVFAHSSASGPTFRTAAKQPDLVKAVVAIEPSSLPGPQISGGHPSCPILLVTGDYLDQDIFWREYRIRLETEVMALRAAGLVMEWLDLPASGISGNSHCPMSDTNADTVASHVQQWLASTIGQLGAELPSE